MPLPPAVRYNLVRLSAFSRPWRRPQLWGPLAMLGLLAVVIPQYWQNPEWRSEYDANVNGPALGSNDDLSALSSEDLADLAEIDNLALLLNQLQPVTANALEQPLADSDRLALPEAIPAESAASPFAPYLERRRFRFSPTASGETVGGETNRREPPLTSGQSPFSAPPAAEALPPNPLQQALNQRLNAQADQPAPPNPSEAAAEPSGLTPPPWMVEGSLPGVDQRFIRTTPEMSPPPGTTGYATPPELATPAMPEPAPVAPLTVDFGSPVAAPAGGAQGRSPLSPFDNSVTSPAQPSPAPFSAPRPPGVYTGNGYINTFSDPSGPVD